MIDIISSIFEGNDYIVNKIDEGLFCMPNKDKCKQEYWLVTTKDIKTIIDNQSDMFQHCKSLCSDIALDKNISMIILFKTTGKISTKEMKDYILPLEEDQYMFKKYVLYYSDAELTEFNNKVNSTKINEFIENNVISREVFDVYKENPYTQTWQSLLYRICIKLPFIKMPIQESVGIKSLYKTNKSNLEDAGVSQIDEILSREMYDLLGKNGSSYSADETFDKLWGLLGGVITSGNQNK